MSFSEDLEQYRERLLRMVDAGVPVKSAALSLGITPGRAYAFLRACGRGSVKTVITPQRRDGVIAVSAECGSINRAAMHAGLSHDAARRILVAAGAVPAERAGAGRRDMPALKRRFLELVGQGWSVTRAAREVGVNERTGRARSSIKTEFAESSRLSAGLRQGRRRARPE